MLILANLFVYSLYPDLYPFKMFSVWYYVFFMLNAHRLQVYRESSINSTRSIFRGTHTPHTNPSIHPFTYWFIRSFTHLCIHSFTHWFIHSFTHLFTHWHIRSFIHSFIYSFIHSLTHSLIHSFIHSGYTW